MMRWSMAVWRRWLTVAVLTLVVVGTAGVATRSPAVAGGAAETAPDVAACDVRPSDLEGGGIALLGPLDGERTGSRPVFCWESDLPPSSCVFLDVSPVTTDSSQVFGWWYRVRVDPAAIAPGGSRAGTPGRSAVVWGERGVEARAVAGSLRPPFDVAPRALPPGVYEWRIAAAPTCADPPATYSLTNVFVVIDPYVALLRSFATPFPRDGYYLTDLLPLDAGGESYLVAVFHPFDDLDALIEARPELAPAYAVTRPVLVERRAGVARLAVYRLDGGFRPVELLRRDAGWYVDLNRDLSGRDLRGDGSATLVVSNHTAGNCWACGWVELYDLDGGVVRPVPLALPAGWSPVAVRDLDGEGRYEIVAVDYRFESLFWCHACSPSSSPVLAWDGAAYVPAAASFPDFYTRPITTTDAALAPALDRGDIENASARAVQALMLAALMGDVDAGWERYLAAVSEIEAGFGGRAAPGVWAANLPLLTRVLARAYGIPDPDAARFLRRGQYPAALDAAIERAAARSADASQHSPDAVAPLWVEVGVIEWQSGERVRVDYHRALDVFRAELTGRAHADGSCDWTDLEAGIWEILGVPGPEMVLLIVQRACTGQP
jgi:hypothetical protein